MGEEQEIIKVKKGNKIINTSIVVGIFGMAVSALGIAVDIITGNPVDFISVAPGISGLGLIVGGICGKAGYKTEQKVQGGMTK